MGYPAGLSVGAAILCCMGNEIPASLREIARCQAGVVTRRQALGAGLSIGMINSKLKFCRWHQIYSGVYATFTGPAGREAQLWAAVLYAGPGAQLSYETAAELNGLTERRAPLINVTIPATRRVRQPRGVTIHRSAYLDHKARFPRGVVPHTLVEETVIDLVNAADCLDDACGWITTAFGRRLTGDGPLRKALSTRKKLRWRGQLDEFIPAAAGGAHSLLEFRYDRDVERAHRLPKARQQVPFTKADGSRGFRDRCYERYELVVELDGKRAHPEERRGHDRRRDNDAAAGGGATLRYDWDDVTRHSCDTAAQVARSLANRGWAGRLTPCSPSCRAAPPTPVPGNPVPPKAA
jgi:very-short-patch-repair endonuclease